MKKVLTIALLAAFGLAAQAPAKTTRKARAQKAPAKVAAVKTSKPKAVEIPKNAVARPDGTYAWKDKQGKSWVFARTPFGVMKTAAESEVTETPTIANAKAIDAGEKVRFETATPFGVVRREKNKADLTDEERKLYESQNPAPAANQN
ncbi:MAG TPA: hypothetical protein VHC72_13480 [Bryobacteraceae bacterium]|nr:hypothetical protein [Bryobacteraceae bacterium]